MLRKQLIITVVPIWSDKALLPLPPLSHSPLPPPPTSACLPPSLPPPVFVAMVIRFKHINTYHTDTIRGMWCLNLLSLCCGFLSVFGLVLVGCFQVSPPSQLNQVPSCPSYMSPIPFPTFLSHTLPVSPHPSPSYTLTPPSLAYPTSHLPSHKLFPSSHSLPSFLHSTLHSTYLPSHPPNPLPLLPLTLSSQPSPPPSHPPTILPPFSPLQNDAVPVVHYVGAFLVFGLGAIYNWFQTYMSFKIYHANLTRHVGSITICLRILLSVLNTIFFASSKVS